MNTQTQILSDIGRIPTVDGVPVFPIYGAQPMGTLSSGDVITARNLLVSSLGDGFDLTTLWEEFESILDQWNNHRTGLASLIRWAMWRP